MNHPYLAVGQEVNYVGGDGKTHKATINAVYGPDSARVEWDGGSAVADCSDKKDANTFHFEQASPKAEHKK
jgi:hypothetical protein